MNLVFTTAAPNGMLVPTEELPQSIEVIFSERRHALSEERSFLERKGVSHAEIEDGLAEHGQIEFLLDRFSPFDVQRLSPSIIAESVTQVFYQWLGFRCGARHVRE